MQTLRIEIPLKKSYLESQDLIYRALMAYLNSDRVFYQKPQKIKAYGKNGEPEELGTFQLIEEKVIETTYSAYGVVKGRAWLGGFGLYPAKEYSGIDSLPAIQRLIEADFNSGGLDSGFGFESLDSCLMKIIAHNKILQDGLDYYNEEEIEFILGNVSESLINDMETYIAFNR